MGPCFSFKNEISIRPHISQKGLTTWDFFDRMKEKTNKVDGMNEPYMRIMSYINSRGEKITGG